MAPFPETEIMTIKRLEVALRKNDFKLLKDGAYKLHEKYHSGFKFEYLDLLKEIFLDISNNAAIPEDIKDILTPTIEDILSSQGIKTDTTTSPYEALNQNRVSSLTSLSYNTSQNIQEESKLNAFDAFGTGGASSQIHQQPQRVFTQSPFSAEPFKEMNLPENNYVNQTNIQAQETFVENNNEEIKQEIIETKTEEATNIYTQNETFEKPAFKVNDAQELTEKYNIDSIEENVEQINSEVKKELKSIAILYSQDSSIEKVKNILKYRELVSKTQIEDVSIVSILSLLSEINTQSNTSVAELKSLLDQLKIKENKVNLVTNSNSANLIGLLKEIEVNYNLPNKNNDANINIIPLLGLTNMFKCQECNQEHIDIDSKVTPLVLQCPKCKGVMYPEFYAGLKNNYEINIDYYNKAMISFANSKVWLLIHPTLEEKALVNLLRSALKISNQVKEIYIVDKDINIRETFKNIFLDIKEDLEINVQMNATEDFYASIG